MQSNKKNPKKVIGLSKAQQTPASTPNPAPAPVQTPSQPLQVVDKNWPKKRTALVLLFVALMSGGVVIYLFSQEGIILHIIGSAISVLAACDLALAPLLLVGPLKTLLKNLFQAKEKSYTKWVAISLISINTFVLLSVIAAALFTPLIQENIFKAAPITGKVLCEGGAQVEGIWVEAQNQGSNFANWYTINENGSEAGFKYTLPNGGDYDLHVGCGGTKLLWAVSATTEAGSGTVKDYNDHYFICYDVPLTPNYGQCKIQN